VSRAGTAAGRPRFVPDLDRRGSQVGDFRVDALIGGGGMGTVYRAVDGQGQAVAIKFLSSALGDAPDLVARFAREVAALSRLQHPAIVRVLAHGREDVAPWFAMELVAGPDLKTRLAEGPLLPEETAAIFARLFAALSHAHARGVVHRDLKPANVLLSPAGAMLADFGIARFDADVLTAPRAVTRLTETAAVLGSLPYMSPEQRRGAEVDGRSDLFSVGTMLYEAATGMLPQGAFASPSALNPRYSKAFDSLVLRLLNPEPTRRPATADEAARALAVATRARPFGGLASRATVGAILTLVMLTGTLGGWALLRRDGRLQKPGAADKATEKPGPSDRRLAVKEQPGLPLQAAGPPAASASNANDATPATFDIPSSNPGDELFGTKNGIKGGAKSDSGKNAFAAPPDWDPQAKSAPGESIGTKNNARRSAKIKVMDYDLKLSAEVEKKRKGMAKTPTKAGSNPKNPRLHPQK